MNAEKNARAASEAWENRNQYDIPFSFIIYYQSPEYSAVTRVTQALENLC